MTTTRPTRSNATLSISDDGYLRLSREDANHFFPEDTMLILRRDGALVLLPTRGAAAGGLVLKQRNVAGDRSVLVSEVFQFNLPVGEYVAYWDDSIGGLRINLPSPETKDVPQTSDQPSLSCERESTTPIDQHEQRGQP